MAKRMNVAGTLEKVGRRLQVQYGAQPIPRAALVQHVVSACGCTEDSVLPSDHCYDRTNNGIPLKNSPMFLHIGAERSGLYRFVGLNYQYTGPLYHYPRNGPPRQVGEWVAGKLYYFGGEKGSP
ncbi:MAG: hypothetical protein FJX77_01310 [Armatimonadetes bacterium]|nr:hypothetical protein [Armatimonadota bacterium]